MALSAADYVLEVSADGLEATLTLVAVPAGGVTLPDLQQALAEHGVTHGIDQAELGSLAAQPRSNVPHVVARGQRPVDGADEQIKYYFDIGNQPSVENEDDADAPVDFRNVRNFNSTPAGTLLAEKAGAAGKPRDGWTVKGAALKSRPGRTVQFKLGKGAALSTDGNRVTAEVDGHACLIADRIGCLEVVEVPAHVDFSIGNIHFIGSVKVKGNVLPGFSVEAGKDVDIQGNVEKANVKAGNTLTVRGIVFGQGDCLLESGGDAHLNAVDQATLRITGNLTLSGYIRHCTVFAGGAMELSGKKGSIVGGEVHAFRGVTTPFLGNQMATLTRIKVGTNPFLSAEMQELEKVRYEQQSKLDQIQTAIEAQLKRKAVHSGPDPAMDAILAKLRLAETQIQGQLSDLEMQFAALQARLAEFKDAKIRVSEIAYPGVVINFRDRLQYKTMDELQRLAFYEDGAEIRTGQF